MIEPDRDELVSLLMLDRNDDADEIERESPSSSPSLYIVLRASN